MKCVTPLGLYTITARPRPPRLARARCTPFRRLGRLQTARLWCRWPTTIEPPLQAVAVEQVGHNDAQCTSCGMAILLCKTSDRGGRGFDLDIRRRRRRIAPLRFFFANWPPSQLTPPVAMLHSPTSCKTSWLACLSFTGAHTGHTKPVAC